MKNFYRLGVALGSLALGAPAAHALNFTFSVTNTHSATDPNTDTAGAIDGTFTGEIFGLTDNTTSAATHVVIESFPTGLNSQVSGPIDATTWDQQYENLFTVTNGEITAGNFRAQQTVNGLLYGYQLYLNGEKGYNFLNLDGQDGLYVYGTDGFENANFHSAAVPVTPATTPEPGSIALLIGITTVGAGFLRRKRRK